MICSGDLGKEVVAGRVGQSEGAVVVERPDFRTSFVSECSSLLLHSGVLPQSLCNRHKQTIYLCDRTVGSKREI